jgi:UDP-N-acetylglucosamine--dolichyl-phosphate N-acetylglucosaminephosphotransferase
MFIPQILNFLYSVPQLFGFIPCPRHRLPKYNTETKKLEGIKTNMNLVNLALLVTGPQTEEELCNKLLVLQCLFSAVGLFSRYILSKVLWS